MKEKIKQSGAHWFFFVFICTLLNAAGQFFLKTGTKNLSFSSLMLLTNYTLFIGVLLYAFSALFLILALKRGDLSLVYPVISLTYVWVAIISFLFLNEPIETTQIGGISSILLGVVLINKR